MWTILQCVGPVSSASSCLNALFCTGDSIQRATYNLLDFVCVEFLIACSSIRNCGPADFEWQGEDECPASLQCKFELHPKTIFKSAAKYAKPA